MCVCVVGGVGEGRGGERRGQHGFLCSRKPLLYRKFQLPGIFSTCRWTLFIWGDKKNQLTQVTTGHETFVFLKDADNPEMGRLPAALDWACSFR